MSSDERSASWRQAFCRRVQYGAFLLDLLKVRTVTPADAAREVSERLHRDPPLTEADARRWWRGEAMPSVEEVEALAEVLRVDPGWLAFGACSTAARPYDSLPWPPFEARPRKRRA